MLEGVEGGELYTEGGWGGGGGGQCSKMHARGEGLKVVSYSQVGSLEPY